MLMKGVIFSIASIIMGRLYAGRRCWAVSGIQHVEETSFEGRVLCSGREAMECVLNEELPKREQRG